MTFDYVSLFSGIGGFEQALNPLGGNCVMASEIDKFANQAYEVLYGHKTVGDVTKVAAEDVPDHDLLVGGFPCQAFSVAGKRLGFEDTRGTLFFEIARIAKVKRPKAMLLENVKGLVSHLSNADFEGALKHQVEKGEIFWQRNENSLTIKSDIVKKNAESYLQKILLTESDLQNDKSFTSSKNMPDILIEKTENYLGYGLTKRLLFLKTQISQTTKKLKDCQDGQIRQLGCKGDDLVLSLSGLSLTDNLKIKDMFISEETVSILSEVEQLWKSYLEESYQVKKSSIISTETNQMTELKTYIYAAAEVNIIASIIKHLPLSANLLKKVSLVLIKKVEPTFSIPTLDVIITTLNDIGYTVDFNVLNSKYFGVPQNRERIFIVAVRDDLIEASPWEIGSLTGVVAKGKKRIGALAGVKTFNFDWPSQEEVTMRLRDILEDNVDEKYYLSEEKTAKLVAQLESHQEIDSDGLQMLGKIEGINGHEQRKKVYSVSGVSPTPSGLGIGGNTEPKIAEPQMLGHIDLKGHDAIKRVYSTEGVSPTLTTMGGGHREPKIAEVRPVLTPDRIEKRQNGRRFKDNDEEAFTLTAQDRHGIALGEAPKYRIRKLTPLECFRLQGFPDSAHQALVDAGISNSQRYKMAGNAVTVNVIDAIGKRLLPFVTC